MTQSPLAKVSPFRAMRIAIAAQLLNNLREAVVSCAYAVDMLESFGSFWASYGSNTVRGGRSRCMAAALSVCRSVKRRCLPQGPAMVSTWVTLPPKLVSVIYNTIYLASALQVPHTQDDSSAPADAVLPGKGPDTSLLCSWWLSKEG